LAHERFKPDAQGLIRTIQQGLGQTSAPAPAQDDLAFRVYADHKARAKARQRRVLRVVGAVFGAIILVRLIFFFLPDLLIWLVVPDHSIRTFTGHSKDITSVAFSPDGRTALSGSLDNTARLWEVATGKQLLTFTGHAPVFPERAIDVVAFSPDGRTALSGRRTERTISNGDGLKLWDLETGKELQTFKLFHGPAAFSPNGRTVLSNGSDTMFGLDPKLKLWDVITGKELRTLRNSPAYVVAFLSDARTALSIDWDGNFTRWDAATGRELRTYKLRERMALWEYIHSVAFSPDGSTALIGSSEKTIKLWDLANGKELQSFTGSKYVPTVAFAPDGRTVVSSGSWHSSLKLWEVATGKELRTFSGHKGIVRAVALSPDGRTALSASEDTTLKLWDLTGP
jgi:WD40 repeat protein